MQKSLGTVLREARESCGLSQIDLALQAQVSQATVSRIEAGARLQPLAHIVARLARALGLPVEVVMASWIHE
mgnify:CR=1 FL=1